MDDKYHQPPLGQLYNPPPPPGAAAAAGYEMSSQAAFALEQQRLQLEYMRLEAERRDREDRLEREQQDRKEKEAYEREREAAHQRMMQLNAQSQATHATLAAQTAMATTANAHGGGVAVVGTETYCGPISWIIGQFLFPCICCCPVDTRPVTMVQQPAALAPAAYPPAYGAPAPGVPIYNASPQVGLYK